MGGFSSKEGFVYRMPAEEKRKQAVLYSNIAAIDFGTTYCSLAYKTTGDPNLTVLRLDSSNSIQRVPNAILLKIIGEDSVCTICRFRVCENKEQCDSCFDIIRHNPNRTREIPSGLMCEVESFGSQAQREYLQKRGSQYEKYILFERTKLSLMKDQFNRDVKVKAVDGREFYAIEVISVILKYLKNKFLSELSRADGTAKKASDFQWVITVPAIWKPRGKQVMREAAYLAGLCSDDIHIHRGKPIITHAGLTTVKWEIGVPQEKHPERVLLAFEPEAAAIELVSTLRESCRFLVVDVGGGTVDVAAHECSVTDDTKGAGMQSISCSILVPAGNEFGGTNVNRNFERFITERIGADRIKAFQEEGRKNSASWNALVYLEFEKEKVAFGGHAYSNSSGHEHLSLKIDARLCHLFKTAFPCNHTGNQDVFFAEDDRVLHIPHSIVEKEFFCPVANGAMQCIRAALQQINDRVDKVYLVGGFGGCKYIYKYLSAQLKARHTQLQTAQRLTRSAQQQTRSAQQQAQGAQQLVQSAQQLTRCIDVIEPKESNLAVIRGAVRFGLNPLVIASRKADATYGIITSVPFDPKIHDKAHRFKDSRNQYYCNNILSVCVEKGEVIPSDRVFATDIAPPLNSQNTMELKIVMTNQTGIEYSRDKESSKHVTELGSLVLNLPKSSESMRAAAIDSANRNVRITLDFSGTELKARAHFNDMKEDTSKDITTIIDFL